MNKQQTAIEWLYNTLNVTPIDQKKWEDIYKQAKEMEKEQIKNAYRTGWINYLPKTDSEQYYNETYES